MGKTAYPVALNFWNYWWKLKVDVKSPASASREAFIATSMARSLHNRTMYFWASPLPREHGLGFHLAGPRNMVSRSGTGNPKCPHPSASQTWPSTGPALALGAHPFYFLLTTGIRASTCGLASQGCLCWKEIIWVCVCVIFI